MDSLTHLQYSLLSEAIMKYVYIQLDPVILAYYDPRPSAQAAVPLLGQLDFVQPFQLVYILEPLINQLPGAGAVRPYLTAVFPGAAAGPVEHMLGAACHGADTAVLV